MAKCKKSNSRSWDIHFSPLLVQGPPEHTLKPLLFFHSEWALSSDAVEDGKINGDLCPVSANSHHDY